MTIARPHVFIASAKEHLEYARAVQNNLSQDFDCTVWDQGVFRMSNYFLDALLSELQRSDFGIFIMAPADVVRKRNKRHAVPRDNVILELGLFAGHLGRERTFLLTPTGDGSDVQLPSDLLGLCVGRYAGTQSGSNLQAALGPACNEIRQLIRERQADVTRLRSGLISARLFSDYGDRFRELIRTTNEVTLFFIHSRRWRENHNDQLREFLSNGQAHLTVFLPDFAKPDLLGTLASHFDDGPQLPGFVKDAFRYFNDLLVQFPRRIHLFLFSAYPSYSFYRFDHRTILALYPNTLLRQAVPAIEIENVSSFGRFVETEIERLRSDSRQPTNEDLH